MLTGLKKVKGGAHIHLTKEDFEIATGNMKNCDEDGKLDVMAFEEIIRSQLWHYVQRKISDALSISTSGPEDLAMLSTMKFVLLNQNNQASQEMSSRLENLETQVVNCRDSDGCKWIISIGCTAGGRIEGRSP